MKDEIDLMQTMFGPTPEEFSHAVHKGLTQRQHRRLPTGISNTWRLQAPDWPLVYSWHPTALDVFPDEIVVTDYEKKTGVFIRLYPEQ